MFKRLMKEAAIEAKQGGERGITARSVKKATVVSTDSVVVLRYVGWDEHNSHNSIVQDSLAKFRG